MSEATTSATKTDDRLSSLRIDPARKDPAFRRRRGAWWRALLWLALGALLFSAYQNSPVAPMPVSIVKAKALEGAGASSGGASAAGAAGSAAPAGETLLSATGYVTPRHRIALSPRVMGKVAWVGIEKGQQVEKDQVLVRLVDNDYRAQVKQSEAGVAASEARLRDLEAGSRPEEVARARADVTRAEAALRNAELLLERRKVSAESNADPRQLLDDAQAARDMAAAALDAAKHQLDLLLAGPRRDQVEAARAELEAAKARLEFARIQLDDTIIRAPIQGTILEKLIEPGELVSPQSFGGSRGARTELLSLADLGDLQVEVDINQSEFSRVSMDQPARVSLEAYPDKYYAGRVREIAPEADRQKATVQVKVQILAPDHLVLPELNARVDLLEPSGAAEQSDTSDKSDWSATSDKSDKSGASGAENTKKAPSVSALVPRAAIVTRDSKSYVFLVQDGKAVQRAVSASLRVFPNSNLTEVTEGLQPGDGVILTRLPVLQNGRRVKVVEELK